MSVAMLSVPGEPRHPPSALRGSAASSPSDKSASDSLQPTITATPRSVDRWAVNSGLGNRFTARLPVNREVDRFGFFISKDFEGARPLTAAEVKLEESRTLKWEAMLENWPVYLARHPRTAKRRARKGIPNAIRGAAWVKIAGADKLKDANPALYMESLNKTPARSDLMCIALDLPRTYPNHCLFSTAHIDATPSTPGSALLPDAALSVGQRSLRNVLRAFACHDPGVGYCQGMAFVAGLLLTYMGEEEAFFMLLALTRGPLYGLAGMYSPGLPRFAEVMHVYTALARRFMPRLCAHFEALGVDHAMYASQWFITLFTYSFPFELVTRAWDAFLFEGWKAVYRVALAVLKANQDSLLRMDFDALMPSLKELANAVPASTIMAIALRLPVRRADIRRMADAYVREHKAEIDARIASAVQDAERKEEMLQEAERSFSDYYEGASEDGVIHRSASGVGAGDIGGGADASSSSTAATPAVSLSSEGHHPESNGTVGRSNSSGGGGRLAAERARVKAAGASALAALVTPRVGPAASNTRLRAAELAAVAASRRGKEAAAVAAAAADAIGISLGNPQERSESRATDATDHSGSVGGGGQRRNRHSSELDGTDNDGPADVSGPRHQRSDSAFAVPRAMRAVTAPEIAVGFSLSNGNSDSSSSGAGAAASSLAGGTDGDADEPASSVKSASAPSVISVASGHSHPQHLHNNRHSHLPGGGGERSVTPLLSSAASSAASAASEPVPTLSGHASAAAPHHGAPAAPAARRRPPLDPHLAIGAGSASCDSASAVRLASASSAAASSSTSMPRSSLRDPSPSGASASALSAAGGGGAHRRRRSNDSASGVVGGGLGRSVSWAEDSVEIGGSAHRTSGKAAYVAGVSSPPLSTVRSGADAADDADVMTSPPNAYADVIASLPDEYYRSSSEDEAAAAGGGSRGRGGKDEWGLDAILGPRGRGGAAGPPGARDETDGEEEEERLRHELSALAIADSIAAAGGLGTVRPPPAMSSSSSAANGSTSLTSHQQRLRTLGAGPVKDGAGFRPQLHYQQQRQRSAQLAKAPSAPAMRGAGTSHATSAIAATAAGQRSSRLPPVPHQSAAASSSRRQLSSSSIASSGHRPTISAASNGSTGTLGSGSNSRSLGSAGQRPLSSSSSAYAMVGGVGSVGTRDSRAGSRGSHATVRSSGLSSVGGSSVDSKVHPQLGSPSRGGIGTAAQAAAAVGASVRARTGGQRALPRSTAAGGGGGSSRGNASSSTAAGMAIYNRQAARTSKR